MMTLIIIPVPVYRVGYDMHFVLSDDWRVNCTQLRLVLYAQSKASLLFECRSTTIDDKPAFRQWSDHHHSFFFICHTLHLPYLENVLFQLGH